MHLFKPSFLAAAAAVALATLSGPATAGDTVHLKVVGGLAAINQYKNLEEPFWLNELPARTKGAVTAEIRPFDRSGLRGQDMLQLMQMGVVPFGTAILSLVAADDPELNAMDLPGLAPDMPAMRSVVEALRPRMKSLLAERYGIELLAVYAYPAQVVYCSAPFASLDDLKGRKIRTSSVGQSEMFEALGAIPVVTPFAEIVPAMRKGVVSCAVTGTLSGHEIGLADAATHLHTMAVGWGISMFAANRGAWLALSDQSRVAVRDGLADLEARVWESAARDTVLGVRCNTGAPDCTRERPGKMAMVQASPADSAALRRVLVEAVLPRWIDRCGTPCVALWNDTLAPAYGIILNGDGDVTGAPVKAKPPGAP